MEKINKIILNRERTDSMSIGGMILFHEGIIAFADSKATILDNKGIQIEDVNRKPKKIIKNNDIIIVTSGNNYVLDDDRTKFSKIEDFLELEINKYSKKNPIVNVENIINDIISKCLFSIDDDSKKEYVFLIGYKEGRLFCVQELRINKNEVVSSHKTYGIDNQNIRLFYIGDAEYVHFLSNLEWAKGYSFSEYQIIIKTVLENYIEILNLTKTYNTVGLPINIEIFQ